MITHQISLPLDDLPRDMSASELIDNTIIQGDNTLVLRNLQRDYTNRIRCIYLDPPYNNAETYTHYQDNGGHEAWRDLLRSTLQLLLPLLRSDGSIWISIDDTEVHYLKTAADDVFGRERFVHTIVWQHRRSRENRRAFSNNHEYILVYANDPGIFRKTRNRVPAAHLRERYKNPDNDPRGPWQSISANVQAGHGTPAQFYTLQSPSGSIYRPPKGRCWVYSQDRMEQAIVDGAVWFGQNGEGVPRLKKYLAESELSVSPSTLWLAEEVGTTADAKRELKHVLPDVELFDTPKPEALLRRIIEISSDPGDLILDPFLGSGTTAAVAHKMGRAYVGIEIGDHAASHCAERLRVVIRGDAGGISPEVGWTGGGGFRFVEQSEHDDAFPTAA